MNKLLAVFVLFITVSMVMAQATTPAVKGSLWENLPKSSGYVNDFEHLFSEEEKIQLTDLLIKFDMETSIEVAIVTISPENTPKDRFEELTLHIAKQWGVGKQSKNNGILIGISSGYHRIRIQNADGIVKVLSDAETRKIIEEVFIPEFKENKYFNGTLNGLKEIMKMLKERLNK